MADTIEPTKKLRVLIDANVLFSGSAWPRWNYEVLRHAVAGDFQLVLSPRIIEEAQKAIAEIAPKEASRFVAILEATQYEAVATPTDEQIEANSKLVRDPKDIHVALAAINAKVDYLVSLDKDLTEPGEPIHQHVNVLLPAVFLRDYMGWTSEQLEAIRNRKWSDLA
jgi:putative PIN family toxin of toxin-antitoxin system